MKDNKRSVILSDCNYRLSPDGEESESGAAVELRIMMPQVAAGDMRISPLL